MTMYTRAFDMRIVTRVWDFYFMDGIPILVKTAIAILGLLEEFLIEVEMDEILPVI